jgi:hypothetical protein
MKVLFAILLLTSLSSNVQAEVKLPGTFVPAQCGHGPLMTSPGAGIRAVEACFGRVVQVAKSVVSISTNDGITSVYRVLKSEPLLNTFPNRETSSKLTLAFAGRLGRKGQLLIDPRARGAVFTMTETRDLDTGLVTRFFGKTSGNLKVDVRNFVFVATTL